MTVKNSQPIQPRSYQLLQLHSDPVDHSHGQDDDQVQVLLQYLDLAHLKQQLVWLGDAVCLEYSCFYSLGFEVLLPVLLAEDGVLPKLVQHGTPYQGGHLVQISTNA